MPGVRLCGDLAAAAYGSTARAGTPQDRASARPCNLVVTTKSSRVSTDMKAAEVEHSRQSRVSSRVSSGTGAHAFEPSQPVMRSVATSCRRCLPYSPWPPVRMTPTTGMPGRGGGAAVTAARSRTGGKRSPSRASRRSNPVTAGSAGSMTVTPTATRRQRANLRCSDQPEAIRQITQGLRDGSKHQVLLGVTGSGKTFTMAKVIEEIEPAGAGAGAQQDAGGAALSRIQVVLPGQRGRVFRQLLRLLPAGSVHSLAATPTSRKKPPSTTSWTNCA